MATTHSATDKTILHATVVSQFWNPPDENSTESLTRCCVAGVAAAYNLYDRLSPAERRDTRLGQFATLIFNQCDKILEMVRSLRVYALEYSRLAFNLAVSPRSEAGEYLEGSIAMAQSLAYSITDLYKVQKQGVELLAGVTGEQFQDLEEVKSAVTGVENALRALSVYFNRHLSHLGSLLDSKEDFGDNLVLFEDAVIRTHETWWAYSKSGQLAMRRIAKAADLIISIPRGEVADDRTQIPGNAVVVVSPSPGRRDAQSASELGHPQRGDSDQTRGPPPSHPVKPVGSKGKTRSASLPTPGEAPGRGSRGGLVSRVRGFLTRFLGRDKGTGGSKCGQL